MTGNPHFPQNQLNVISENSVYDRTMRTEEATPIGIDTQEASRAHKRNLALQESSNVHMMSMSKVSPYPAGYGGGVVYQQDVYNQIPGMTNIME